MLDTSCCVWQCKLLGRQKGREGKSSYCVPALQAAGFVKGDDEETFLYSKECKGNESICSLSTSLMKQWL